MAVGDAIACFGHNLAIAAALTSMRNYGHDWALDSKNWWPGEGKSLDPRYWCKP